MSHPHSAPGMAAGTPAARQRDVRLDFFRGIAMLIIFIAHVPWDSWVWYIPARFGPSDATEMFVFCSGFASALAFGRVFVKDGFISGLRRILYRCWQIYWVHVTVFFVTLAVIIWGTNTLGTEVDYIDQLGQHRFLEEFETGIVHLLTLRYVPGLFDILPMYIVVLAMVPLVVALKRIGLWAVAAFSFGLWAVTQLTGIGLPGNWWSDFTWYFNPFAWQLIFFTGFAFGAGWVPAPPKSKLLVWIAALFVVAMIPVGGWNLLQPEGFAVWLEPYSFLYEKSDFGILRWVHFLALAYLCLQLVNDRRHLLNASALRPLVKVGQQSLAVFLTSIVLSRFAGMYLDLVGHDEVSQAIMNLGGFAILIATAYTVSWFKGVTKTRQSSAQERPKAQASQTLLDGRYLPAAGD